MRMRGSRPSCTAWRVTENAAQMRACEAMIVAAVAIYSRRRVIARRIRFSTNSSSGEASPSAAVLESDAHEGSAR